MRTPLAYLQDEGVFGWNYKHILTHPWILFEEMYRRSKWFIQRGHRGYADCDGWSIDWYLCSWMPEAIRRLKGGHGYPAQVYMDMFGETELGAEWPEENCKLAHSEWQLILEEIALGFEAARKIQNYDFEHEELPRISATMNDGLDLFKKYFLNLWD